MDLEKKTTQELRALARERRMSGYSKLTKRELVHALERAETGARETARKASARATTSPPKPLQQTKQEAPPATVPTPAVIAQATSQEQLVEDLKFALVPPGAAAAPPTPWVDLGEDIDRLPDIIEPSLCLLPQKPGILYGYWVLSAGFLQRHPGLVLRLCHFEGETLYIVEELRLPSESGHWYFHVIESLADREVFLQLGFYRDHEFITPIRRGIARVPKLTASSREDRRWWVSPEQFRAMYVRAGGVAEGAKLGWSTANSFSSR